MFRIKKKTENTNLTSTTDTSKPDIHNLLYPIRHITKFLLNKKDTLLIEESNTIKEIQDINASYKRVTDSTSDIKSSVEGFKDDFNDLLNVSASFSESMNEIIAIFLNIIIRNYFNIKRFQTGSRCCILV